METLNNISGGTESGNPTDTVALMDIVRKYIKHWKWFIISLVVVMFAAFVYLRYATPIYTVESDIKLKDASGSSAGGVMFEELGMVGAVDNISDEAEVIRSRNIVRTTINRLKLHTSYIVEGRVKSTDLYKNSPVEVGMEQSQLDKLDNPIEFAMKVGEDGVHVSGIIGGVMVDTTFIELPALLASEVGNISFVRRDGVTSNESLLNVVIENPNATITKYRNNLTVASKNPRSRSAVLNMAINTSYPEKGKDFLAMLVDVYNNEMIEDKNMEALNTQKFINERLSIIDEELSDADASVENYKQTQGLTNIQADLQRDMQMGNQYEQQLVEVETQINVVSSLRNYVNNSNNNDKPIPSNIGINDPTLVATANEYNKLLMERERMAQSMTDENPAMRRLNEQISSLRSNINSSISSVQEGLNIQRRDSRNQVNMYGGRLSTMPTQEREFVDLTREQQIKQNLFLMLLQKREENALALAATSNTAKILNEAVKTNTVFPKTKIILLAAFLLALMIPVGIIYLVDLLQYKIRTRADVEKLSKISMLSEIPTNDTNKIVVVGENQTSVMDEAFRTLRTNFMLLLGKDNKVAMFTSTVPGEGKTFISINTAISVSLLNKRVLIIGGDFRKPRMHEYLNLKTADGLSNYLSGFETDLDKLIVPSGITENLWVLPAGPIPPNPAELISRNTMDDAIEQLRDKFDYIIIDSAPVGPVTDALVMNRVADATVYVARANYSSKQNIIFANDLNAKNKLKNMVLVINDIDISSAGGYGYGYGYGYGDNKKKKKKRKRK